MDERWIRKDSQIIHTTISVKCLRRADRSVNYFVALMQVITARKHAEEALRRAHDELEVEVVERTRELADANRILQAEIAQRK